VTAGSQMILASTVCSSLASFQVVRQINGGDLRLLTMTILGKRSVPEFQQPQERSILQVVILEYGFVQE
jgi:hypothetical protein